MAKSKRKPLTADGWVNVTVPLTDGMLTWPGDPEVQINRVLDIKKGEPANVTKLHMGAHTGTHMDAPCHFLNSKSGIDKMPLDAVLGKVRVIGIENKEIICVKELKPHRIRKGERILFKTKNSSVSWHLKPFTENYVSLSEDTALYLAERKVKSVGIDYLSISSALCDGVKVHKALLKAGVWPIEGLDLSKVEPGEYEMICLPLRVIKSDGSPVRALLRKL